LKEGRDSDKVFQNSGSGSPFIRKDNLFQRVISDLIDNAVSKAVFYKLEFLEGDTFV
jgi:hypothetical protein